MTIANIFDIGQVVWYLNGIRAAQTEVSHIYITISKDAEGRISTYISYGITSRVERIEECAIFPSKEELLKSL